VESFCEFRIETLSSIKCWETIESKQLGISRAVLSSMELVRVVSDRQSTLKLLESNRSGLVSLYQLVCLRAFFERDRVVLLYRIRD
jgi:hypothetical protein